MQRKKKGAAQKSSSKRNPIQVERKAAQRPRLQVRGPIQASPNALVLIVRWPPSARLDVIIKSTFSGLSHYREEKDTQTVDPLCSKAQARQRHTSVHRCTSAEPWVPVRCPESQCDDWGCGEACLVPRGDGVPIDQTLPSQPGAGESGRIGEEGISSSLHQQKGTQSKWLRKTW